MIRMIILRRMRQHERGTEPAEDFRQFFGSGDVVLKSAVRNTGTEELRFEEAGGGSHFAPAYGSQIWDRLLRLALVAAAHDTNTDRCALVAGPGEGTGAEQLRVVRMSHDCQDTFGGEIEFHSVLSEADVGWRGDVLGHSEGGIGVGAHE